MTALLSSLATDRPMYIEGTGAISPQLTHTGTYPFNVTHMEGSSFMCQEPDYKEWIPPRMSRRMSRVIKMGVASALMALRDANLERPEAIVTGTGYGCMSDTEKFLESISENKEAFLNPAPFIHSTHNTISSQIALLIKCTGYNQTFVHGPLSFESALVDGLMLLNEKAVQSVLVGGVDEMTPRLFAITSRFDCWKKTPVSSQNLFSTNSKGSIAGEGSCFFLLNREQSPRSYARITDVTTRVGALPAPEFASWINDFLSKNHVKPADLDLCLLGKNGDNRFDSLYADLQENLFKGQAIGYYKPLCGEYLTASAFAVWLSANILKSQKLPLGLTTENKPTLAGASILIINRYQTRNQSLILLQAC